MKKVLSVLLALMMLAASAAAAETLTGTADGFAGPITAEVTVEDGAIVGLTLTGEMETPSIGGAALQPLADAILAAGSLDGVDAYAGATWTSNGVFAAVRAAMGVEEAPAEEETVAASASGLKQGLGMLVTPRLGPGSDDQEVPVYSFNTVIAYVLTDADGRIVDLETDILEIITPNHDAADDNMLAGWPSSTYNYDSDGDGKVDGLYEQTEENFTEALSAFTTKRERGAGYKMNSGTWEQEMDAYESIFRGLTAEELQAWAAERLSDVNGRALHGTSANELDVAKWEALTDDARAEMDAVSSATMSLTDAHGNILGAVLKALEKQEPVAAEKDIAKLGLGVLVTPRLGPGADDQEVKCYSFNVVAAGAAFDAEDRIAAVKEDILEIITPNHDGANDNAFIGWPGQSYNNDADGDGKVEGTAEQTPESFTEMLTAFRTKRDLDTLYKMNSGTWAQEMDLFEGFFAGKTTAELRAFFEKQTSANGRIIRADTQKEEDLAKWAALTDEEKAAVDAISGATMSLSDAHGDILGALEKAFAVSKPSEITVE